MPMYDPITVSFPVCLSQNRKLEFSMETPRWKGHVATISPITGAVTWGVLWKLNKEHLGSLDE